MSELPTPIMQQAGETPERQAGAFERIDCAHDIELSLKLARGGVAGFDLSVDLDKVICSIPFTLVVLCGKNKRMFGSLTYT